MQDWGISDGYHDIAGRWIDVPAETLAAIRAAMGAPPDPEDSADPGPPGTSPGDDPVVSFRPGQAPAGITAGGPWELHTEDGAVLTVESDGDLPPDLPLGYHRLRHVGNGVWGERLLIVSPGRCHLPADLRTWGWAAQLYAARSRESWGIGDLADLRRLAEWSRGMGAGMCLLNPLHASVPDYPQPSPYYPSSRCFRNPIYLRIEDVPGAGAAADAGFDLPALAAEGRALNNDRRIDRQAVWKLKKTALEHLWSRFSASGGDPAFEAFRAEHGETLKDFATHYDKMQDAKAKGLEVKVGRFPFSANGRARTAGETDGFVKIVRDAKYGEIIGAHIVGSHASELIHELVVAKTNEYTVEEVDLAIHAHPTLSEAIAEAALDSMGRVIHI